MLRIFIATTLIFLSLACRKKQHEPAKIDAGNLYVLRIEVQPADKPAIINNLVAKYTDAQGKNQEYKSANINLEDGVFTREFIMSKGGQIEAKLAVNFIDLTNINTSTPNSTDPNTPSGTTGNTPATNTTNSSAPSKQIISSQILNTRPPNSRGSESAPSPNETSTNKAPTPATVSVQILKSGVIRQQRLFSGNVSSEINCEINYQIP